MNHEKTSLVVITSIVISLVIIGLVFSSIQQLESTINPIQEKMDRLTQENKFLSQKIESLESRIENLENIQRSSSSLVQKQKFAPTIIIDGNGLPWTSNFFEGSGNKNTAFSQKCSTYSNQACYININPIETPYGIGVSVDSIGSLDWDYWFFGVSEKYKVPKDGKVTISGNFLKDDRFYSYNLEEGRSYFLAIIFDEDGNEILTQEKILNFSDQNNNWYKREMEFNLEPDQVIKIGLGRGDSWQQDWSLYGAWSDVKIDAIKLN